MNTFLQDLRYGLRMLAKNPGFTVVGLLTLALGIGANTAIFSVVNSVLLGPLPFRDADRLAIVWESRPAENQNTINPANFMDWKEQNNVFEDMAAFADFRSVVIGDGEPEEIPSQIATPNLFSVLGVEALRGRTLLPGDGKDDQQPVVVISYGLWQRRFGGRSDIVGYHLNLNRRDVTIVGVMPQSFGWFIKKGSLTDKAAEMWMPFVIEGETRQRHGRFMTSVARLKPGVTLEQA